MNTKKIIKSCVVLLLTTLITTSCSDYLDVNDNPNDPEASIPKYTLPVAQRDLAALNSRTMTYLGMYIGYAWATPSNWSANQEFSRYDVDSNFYSTIFETSYASIFKNLTFIENFEDKSGSIDYSAYKAMSAVLKGYQYQYLVDLYGNVPYTEANQRSVNITPKYDDAQTIYKSIIDNLTAAATTALDLPSNAENPGGQDIIFKGTMTKWAQFANTVKLRMLVRLSNTNQDAYIKAQIALIEANGAGYITADVTSNPGYSDSADKQNPFYGYFRNPILNSETDRGDYTVASDYAIAYLTGTGDLRINRLYANAQANGAKKGAPQVTTLPGSGFTSRDLSKVGPGLIVAPTASQIIMGLPEALLLQAEAITRGYIAGGDAAAKTKYEEAIIASYIKLMGATTVAEIAAATAQAQTYYNQAQANVSWTASPNKIEAIITQKWVALNGTSSIELWIEKTRTGFPAALPMPAEGGGTRPVRLLYPASEIARNAQNVPAQTTESAFNDNPFWK